MVKFCRALSGALVVVAFAACSDPLTILNSNEPDRARVLGTPTDVEVLIQGTYKTIFNGTFGVDGISPSARSMSWENASNLANWGLGPRSAIPRAPIDNVRGNSYMAENQLDFNAVSRALRTAALGVNKMDSLTLGSEAANARARAFGWFSAGVAMGYLAMTYDSATIVDPHADQLVVPDLSYYTDVAAAALVALDSALAQTNTARTVTGGYGTGTMLPDTWLNGSAFTADRFTQLIRTYKAYFRANVARSPTERAAVNWANVRDDAAAGITADFNITTGTAVGWMAVGNQWWLYQQWGQLNQMIGGMADSSCVIAATGALVACGSAGSVRQYDNWLGTGQFDKVAFLIRTLDRRFPAGNTRATQITNSPSVSDGILYYRNRSASDPDAAPWSSYYEWFRLRAWYLAARVGAFPTFVKAQNDLLRAEALIRLGDIPGAAALIDITRTRNGLSALSGAWAATATATTPVPGGDACVPHIPQASGNYVTTECGNIMEAMKWEYRMETTYVSYVSQWMSGRGWGDLPEGTAVHWPVPYQEMDARLHPFYSVGGIGRPGGSVGKGNYGF